MNLQSFTHRAGCAVAVFAGCLALATPADAGWGGAVPPVAALYADGTTLYGLTSGSGSLSVWDTATGTTLATIGLGSEPSALAGATGCRMLYAANADTALPLSTGGTISAIDTATDTVTATIPTGGSPFAAALSPSCGTLYAGDSTGKAVAVIDTATDAVTSTIPVGNYPWALALAPDGSRVYTANVTDDTVSVIDTTTNSVIATIPVGAQPDALAVAADGKTLFVVNNIDNDVSMIDTASDTVSATFPVGSAPDSLAFAAPGVLLVGHSGSGLISVIDTATGSVAQTVSPGSTPNAVAVSAATGTIYSLDGSGDLSDVAFSWTSDPTIALPNSETAPRVGDMLTAEPSTWIPSAITYQWNAGGEPIAGATASSFTLTTAVAGEPITVTVSNSAGSKTSAATPAVAAGAVAPPSPGSPSTPPSSGSTPTLPSTTSTTSTPSPNPVPPKSAPTRKRSRPKTRLRQRLTVAITGPTAGATYFGAAPPPRCITHTNRGRTRCRITQRVTPTPSGTTVKYTARATGSAGASAETTLTVHTANLDLGGLQPTHGIYVVKLGDTYTLSVTSRSKPLYVDAAVAPQPPAGTHDWFRRSGETHGIPIWRLRVYLPEALGAFAAWNIGIHVGGRLDVLTIRT